MKVKIESHDLDLSLNDSYLSYTHSKKVITTGYSYLFLSLLPLLFIMMVNFTFRIVLKSQNTTKRGEIIISIEGEIRPHDQNLRSFGNAVGEKVIKVFSPLLLLLSQSYEISFLTLC